MIKRPSLSERMRHITELVIHGEPAADIGTDHALVPIGLIKDGICPNVILTDVRRGPLEKAERNLEAAGIDPQAYELRLGSGLEVLSPGEVSSVIIAGMGGELISQLLGLDLSKTRSFKRLILQPRSRANDLRRWLDGNSFYITCERLATEAGRISEIICVEPQNELEHELFEHDEDYIVPPMLFESGDPLLPGFLEHRIAQAQTVCDELTKSGGDVADKTEYWSERLRRLKEKRSLL